MEAGFPPVPAQLHVAVQALSRAGNGVGLDAPGLEQDFPYGFVILAERPVAGHPMLFHLPAVAVARLDVALFQIGHKAAHVVEIREHRIGQGRGDGSAEFRLHGKTFLQGLDRPRLTAHGRPFRHGGSWGRHGGRRGGRRLPAWHGGQAQGQEGQGKKEEPRTHGGFFTPAGLTAT